METVETRSSRKHCTGTDGSKSRNRAARRPPCHCPPLSLGPSAHPSVGGPGAAPAGGLGGGRHDVMRTGVVRSELRAARSADCGRRAWAGAPMGGRTWGGPVTKRPAVLAGRSLPSRRPLPVCLVSEAGSVPSSTARGLSTAGDESRDAISASSSRASSSALRQRGSTVVSRQGGGGVGLG